MVLIISFLHYPTLATNTPMTEVASSGAEEPAAMNVAPATSGDRFIATQICLQIIQNFSTNYYWSKVSIIAKPSISIYLNES